jgi:hypothetical protein
MSHYRCVGEVDGHVSPFGCLTLKMNTVITLNMTVTVYQTIRSNIAEDLKVKTFVVKAKREYSVKSICNSLAFVRPQCAANICY